MNNISVLREKSSNAYTNHSHVTGFIGPFMILPPEAPKVIFATFNEEIKI